jgi:hypothetical protein
MSALILLNLSVIHNFKYSTCQNIFNEYLQTAFYEKLVDIFIMYLHIKFHIPLHNQLLLDIMTGPVNFR